MNKFPLLIVSDSPSCTSGLGRITRELAARIHEHISALVRVGTLGYGGPGSAAFDWPDYHIHSIEDWLIPELPLVWRDFAGYERGAVLFIWDPSRVRWFSRPDRCSIPALAAFLHNPPFEKWIYSPVDAEGPDGKLSVLLRDALHGFDRVLAYSEWARGVMGVEESIPHGIGQIHSRLSQERARRDFRLNGFRLLKDDSFLIGIVATNQARKDFGLAFEICAAIPDALVWIHTDELRRYWDIQALVNDFRMVGRVVVTTANYTDEQMVSMYSACDVTLGIGLGEGFGYPIYESLACGVPCIHGDYGGGAEWLPEWMKVKPREWRWEGVYNNRRPVFAAKDWREKIDLVRDGGEIEWHFPSELLWENVWPRWEKWIKEGLR